MAVTVVIRSTNVRREGEPAPSLTFDAARVVIGRGDGCELRLPDPSVSSRHASIRQKGSGYVLEDEGSTNGTFLGGQRLAPHAGRPVGNGDLVRVGRVWIEIRMEAAAAPSAPQATKELALLLVQEAIRGVGGDERPRLTCTEGPDAGRVLILDRPAHPYTVGRGHDVDLPLEESDASRRHFQVTRKGEHLYLRDLGSKNGSSLAGERVAAGRDVLVRPGVALAVGEDVFLYENPAAVALAELDRAADTRFSEADLPARPPAPIPASPAEPTPEAQDVGPVSPEIAKGSSAPMTTSPSAASSGLEARGAAEIRAKSAQIRESRGWDASDFLIVLAALVVLGVSIGGLTLLFRG